MGMKRGLAAAIAACGLAVALVGCSPAQTSVTVNGRTLLMHHSSGASADALGHGVLGVNSWDCITIGTEILVATDDSSLLPNGSIVIHGKTYKLGQTVQLGGGGGDAPKQSDGRCGVFHGRGPDYFWAG
jgi:hypothetical protein